jgi:hypothetical protein
MFFTAEHKFVFAGFCIGKRGLKKLYIVHCKLYIERGGLKDYILFIANCTLEEGALQL